ncbi:hypothetical protein [Natrarchaeobaculum sulfurireducens]|uniref:DUF8014 domain-containing protein n=1 Tax=Natrarchaeobaculum sulfurireducens TaxID=2044521 RepID=A0A346PDC4_9EURY|nr:hypothetical protein [Natrarchaeobaculum sulfurireducens]AXR77519.1 hypothetical protein AArc1_1179 [Natrarchaeobaculum sulfurireducens]AXR82539.1 hypothetical protein AArcMg_2548 [Natrarchaeobaculum sulfurireducens]
MECSEPECSRPAVVELHIPWDDNRLVCAPHARVLGRQNGVVADPLPDCSDELLE